MRGRWVDDRFFYIITLISKNLCRPRSITWPLTLPLQGFTWFRDEDALTWQDWMDYWESPEGVKQGGPPKRDEIFVEVSGTLRLFEDQALGKAWACETKLFQPTAIENPRVEVELHLKDTDFLSGYLLNEKWGWSLIFDGFLLIWLTRWRSVTVFIFDRRKTSTFQCVLLPQMRFDPEGRASERASEAGGDGGGRWGGMYFPFLNFLIFKLFK